MATGKTEVGRSLARFMKMRFVDTDDLIEEREDTKISEIFSKKGEKYFRDMESAMAEDLGGSDNCVISTGGGFVLRPQNIEKIRNHGWIIHLHASVDKILERVKDKTDRPLLNVEDKKDKIEHLLENRKPFYDNCDFSFDTTNTTPDQVAELIIEKLGIWKKSK